MVVLCILTVPLITILVCGTTSGCCLNGIGPLGEGPCGAYEVNEGGLVSQYARHATATDWPGWVACRHVDVLGMSSARECGENAYECHGAPFVKADSM